MSKNFGLSIKDISAVLKSRIDDIFETRNNETRPFDDNPELHYKLLLAEETWSTFKEMIESEIDEIKYMRDKFFDDIDGGDRTSHHDKKI